MVAIKVDYRELSQGRFVCLQEQMGWTRAEALGCIALFWADTRNAGVEQGSLQVLQQYISAGSNRAQVLQALAAAGYLQPITPQGVFAIAGNEGCAAKAQARQAQARKAGAASAAKRKAKPRAKKTAAAPAAALALAPAAPAAGLAAPQPPTAYQLACKHTWEAYASAYQRQTGQLPARNAKTNALVQQLVQRLGHEEAPQVAAFYVGHPNPYYANRVWPLDALVKDAEPMRTQWAAKVRVTPQAAQAAAQQSHYEARRARLADDGI